MFDFSKFGKGVHYYRLKANITQAKLAEMVDVGEQHINKIENGLTKPSLKVFVNICNVLHVSVKDCLYLNQETSLALYRQMVSLLEDIGNEDKTLLLQIMRDLESLDVAVAFVEKTNIIQG